MDAKGEGVLNGDHGLQQDGIAKRSGARNGEGVRKRV